MKQIISHQRFCISPINSHNGKGISQTPFFAFTVGHQHASCIHLKKNTFLFRFFYLIKHIIQHRTKTDLWNTMKNAFFSPKAGALTNSFMFLQ